MVRPLGMIGAIQDITKTKREENRLKLLENGYYSI
jgi:hypothetical protein